MWLLLKCHRFQTQQEYTSAERTSVHTSSRLPKCKLSKSLRTECGSFKQKKAILYPVE